jgi:hypothetical protein
MRQSIHRVTVISWNTESDEVEFIKKYGIGRRMLSGILKRGETHLVCQSSLFN